MKKLIIVLVIVLCTGTAWAVKPQFFVTYYGQTTTTAGNYLLLGADNMTFGTDKLTF